MRVVMFGAGGVGGYFGARLVEAGHDVVFIARGAHLAALRRDGLRVESPAGDARLARVSATDDPRAAGPADLVIVAVKSWQLPEASRGLSTLLEGGGVVLPLLNGVEAAAQLAEVVGDDRVLKGLARIISFIASPGTIRHVGAEPTMALGEPDGRPSERVQRVAGVLRGAGIRTEVPDDIDAALWLKFLFVVPIGGLGAVTRAPMGVVRSQPDTRALLEAAMHEVQAVAAGHGVALPADTVPKALRFIETLPAEGTASLHRDVAEGRRSELDAWNGAVVRLGREAGVPTPVHAFIYHSLLPLERRARGEIAFA